MSQQRPDSVGQFLEDMEYHGKSERTREAYERVLRRFEAFLEDPSNHDGAGPLRPADADRRACMAFVHYLRADDSLSRSTVATYASYLHRFYAYMTQAGEFESNPMALVMEEMDESIETDPARRDIALHEMRDFVGSIARPLDFAVVVTLLKTGIRVGELCNLDLRDLNLDAEQVTAVYDVGTRAAVLDRPNTLYIDDDIARGEVVNGEERTASNKRKRATVIPVDDELRYALVRYLAVRPAAYSEADPLFVAHGGSCGRRVTPDMVRDIVRRHAEPRGWYRRGAGPEENVTPHYFRHFFTTHLRDRTGERGIVKYLRGDVAEDVIDTYTHNWGERVREAYEANIYRLLAEDR